MNWVRSMLRILGILWDEEGGMFSSPSIMTSWLRVMSSDGRWVKRRLEGTIRGCGIEGGKGG